MTPTVYAQHDATFLMEYLQPGHFLKELVSANQDDAATKIICQIICELQSAAWTCESYPKPSAFELASIYELEKYVS